MSIFYLLPDKKIQCGLNKQIFKMVKPKASSTPKLVGITGRRSIRDVNGDSIQSPIVNYSPNQNDDKEHRLYHSNSEEEYDDNYVDSNDETDNGTEEKIFNTTFGNCVSSTVSVIAIAVLVGVIILYTIPEDNKVNAITSAKILSQEFPSQVEDFWIFVDEGIMDIKRFQKPRTFVFVFNDESQETLEKILKRIVQVATCTLTSCGALPVILTANALSDPHILADYGEIITRNKEKLEESGVMIVKNLDKVPAASAQAFHSFCDEFNPVVDEALFIFTMKIDRFDMKHVENYLRDRWKDIEDDKFSALFTRIANVVLPIVVEK